jgi:hypothetical protein
MPNGGSLIAYLADGSNFISGANTPLASYPGMPPVYTLSFSIFPRRDRDIALRIFQRDSKGILTPCNTLSFSNPVYRAYPQWQAEVLPATKRTGDLEVTLKSFKTGPAGGNNNVVALKFHPLQNTSEIWQAAGVELSDATGNSVSGSGSSSTSWNNGDFELAFSPGLWPSESAWKLKLAIKRAEGFRPEEEIVFKNVPLGQLDRTNVVAWTTNVNGVSVTLQNILRRAPNTNSSWSSSQLSALHVTLSALPDGSPFDLVRMVCDTGQTTQPCSTGIGGGERSYNFLGIPLAAQTADFIFVLQQTRMVEFTVKPELPEPELKPKK